MVLPSQSARPTFRRSHMFRRRRNSIIKFVVIAAIVVAVPAWLAYSMLSGDDGERETTTENGANLTSNQASNQATNQSTTAPPTIRDPERPAAGSAPPREPQGISNPNLLGNTGGNTGQNTPPAGGSTPTAPNQGGAGNFGTGGGDAGASNVSFAELKRVREYYSEGFRLFSEDPVRAREFLSRAYVSGLLPAEDEKRVRVNLARLNETLVFSRTVVPGDPFAQSYTVQPNDSLSGIVSKRSLLIDHRLLARINNLKNPNTIRLGQQLKLITGPFHLVVHKNAYRADLFLGDADERVFVRSFDVGLGESNTTPVGTFRVRPNSKLINPEWTNPRTGQRFAADDPKNPIGEYWIGLEGIDAVSKTFEAYGIHGTIEPNSIGGQMSMGCIRMRDEDIAIVYESLVENASVIEIRP